MPQCHATRSRPRKYGRFVTFSINQYGGDLHGHWWWRYAYWRLEDVVLIFVETVWFAIDFLFPDVLICISVFLPILHFSIICSVQRKV